MKTLLELRNYFQGSIEQDATYLPVLTRRVIGPVPSVDEVKETSYRAGRDLASTGSLESGLAVLKEIFYGVFKLTEFELAKKHSPEDFRLQAANDTRVIPQSYEYYQQISQRIQDWILKPMGAAYRTKANDMPDLLYALFNREAVQYSEGLTENKAEFQEQMKLVANQSFAGVQDSLKKLEAKLESMMSPVHPLLRTSMHNYDLEREKSPDEIDLKELLGSLKDAPALDEELPYLVNAALRILLQDQISLNQNSEASYERSHFEDKIEFWKSNLLQPLLILLKKNSATNEEFQRRRKEIFRDSVGFTKMQLLLPPYEDFDEFLPYFVKDNMERMKITNRSDFSDVKKGIDGHPSVRSRAADINTIKTELEAMLESLEGASYPENEAIQSSYDKRKADFEEALDDLGQQKIRIRKELFPIFDEALEQAKLNRQKIWQDYNKKLGKEYDIYELFNTVDVYPYRDSLATWLNLYT